MIIDQEDLALLRKNGVKVKGRIASVERPAPDQLQRIADALEGLLKRPEGKSEQPVINVAAPNVNVCAPDVSVTTPNPAPPVLKWKFTIERGAYGRMTEVIATAIR